VAIALRAVLLQAELSWLRLLARRPVIARLALRTGEADLYPLSHVVLPFGRLASVGLLALVLEHVQVRALVLERVQATESSWGRNRKAGRREESGRNIYYQ
jgi:hypothetical protein